MVFSRPETPMTATSWGAPEHWPASPFDSFRPHTPDIGFREQHSRPATPSTATSWGAPECWPPSPIECTRPQTPDYAQRVHDEDHPALFNHARPWAHVWPFSEIRKEQQRALLESKHGSFRFVWPFIGKDVQPAVDSMSRGAYDDYHPASFSHAKPWVHVWPFTEILKEQQRDLLESRYGGFRFVWPFMGQCSQLTLNSSSRDVHNEGYPASSWPHVWPFSEIRYEQQRALLESKHGSFRFVWPFIGKDAQPAVDSMSRGAHDDYHPASSSHPNTWVHVWPFTEILKEQQRALLESKYGGFRFVWPFMAQCPQLTLNSSSRGVHDEDYPASSWPHVWPFSEIRKEQQRAMFESKHGSFRFVWPFVGKDLQPTIDSTSREARNKEYPTSFNSTKAWPYVWPLSGIRKEQERTLLESRYGSFRFVWPFMGHGAQELVIDWTSRGDAEGSAMVKVMGLETNNKTGPLAFVWPFFQTARSHPTPQSVIVPTTYPFLQICKFYSLSLLVIPPLCPPT